MATPKTIIAVAGVTGTIGTLVAKHLLKFPNVHVKGLCRDPTKISLSLRSDVNFTETKIDSSDAQSLRQAVRKADVTVCCYLGDLKFMVDGQKLLIDACIVEGVPRYIASDYSMDFRKLAHGDHPAKDPMKHVADYLDEKSTEIKAVHILNACFLEAPWRGIWDGKTKSFRYWGTGDEKWELTSHDNVAEFTANVALDKEANGYLSICGDTISIKEMAAAYEVANGKTPKLENLGTLEQLYNTMHAVKAREASNIWAWLSMFYVYYSINGQTTLPLIKDTSRYPSIKLVTALDYFRKFKGEDFSKGLTY